MKFALLLAIICLSIYLAARHADSCHPALRAVGVVTKGAAEQAARSGANAAARAAATARIGATASIRAGSRFATANLQRAAQSAQGSRILQGVLNSGRSITMVGRRAPSALVALATRARDAVVNRIAARIRARLSVGQRAPNIIARTRARLSSGIERVRTGSGVSRKTGSGGNIGRKSEGYNNLLDVEVAFQHARQSRGRSVSPRGNFRATSALVNSRWRSLSDTALSTGSSLRRSRSVPFAAKAVIKEADRRVRRPPVGWAIRWWRRNIPSPPAGLQRLASARAYQFRRGLAGWRARIGAAKAYGARRVTIISALYRQRYTSFALRFPIERKLRYILYGGLTAYGIAWVGTGYGLYWAGGTSRSSDVNDKKDNGTEPSPPPPPPPIIPPPPPGFDWDDSDGEKFDLERTPGMDPDTGEEYYFGTGSSPTPLDPNKNHSADIPVVYGQAAFEPQVAADDYTIWQYQTKSLRMDIHNCGQNTLRTDSNNSRVVTEKDTGDMTFRVARFMTAGWKDRCSDCNCPLLRFTTDLWTLLFFPSASGESVGYEGKIVSVLLVNGSDVHGNKELYSGEHREDTFMEGSDKWGVPHIKWHIPYDSPSTTDMLVSCPIRRARWFTQPKEKPEANAPGQIFDNSCSTANDTYNGLVYINTYDIIDGIPFEYLVTVQLPDYKPFDPALARVPAPSPATTPWDVEVLRGEVWPAIARSYTDDYVDLTVDPPDQAAGMLPIRCGDEDSKNTLYAEIASSCHASASGCRKEETYERAIRIRDWNVKLALHTNPELGVKKYIGNITGVLQVISDDKEGYWILDDDDMKLLEERAKAQFVDIEQEIYVKEIMWYVDPNKYKALGRGDDYCGSYYLAYDRAIYMKTYNDITMVMHFASNELTQAGSKVEGPFGFSL